MKGVGINWECIFFLTILTSDTEEIDIMYIVTPTSTGRPVLGAINEPEVSWEQIGSVVGR